MSPGVCVEAGCGGRGDGALAPGLEEPYGSTSRYDRAQSSEGFFCLVFCFGFFFSFPPSLHHKILASKLITSPVLVLGAHFG